MTNYQKYGVSPLSIITSKCIAWLGESWQIASKMSLRGCFRFLLRLLFCVAIVGVLQLHIIGVQLFAWTTMIADRAPERGFTDAVKSVVSGAEPCSMCTAVANHTDTPASPERRDKDAKPSNGSSLEKMASDTLAQDTLPPIDEHGRMAWCVGRFTESSVEADVPTPPPRA